MIVGRHLVIPSLRPREVAAAVVRQDVLHLPGEGVMMVYHNLGAMQDDGVTQVSLLFFI